MSNPPSGETVDDLLDAVWRDGASLAGPGYLTDPDGTKYKRMPVELAKHSLRQAIEGVVEMIINAGDYVPGQGEPHKNYCDLVYTRNHLENPEDLSCSCDADGINERLSRQRVAAKEELSKLFLGEQK